jgi:hypothetical protein
MGNPPWLLCIVWQSEQGPETLADTTPSQPVPIPIKTMHIIRFFMPTLDNLCFVYLYSLAHSVPKIRLSVNVDALDCQLQTKKARHALKLNETGLL